ncbi:hypothetical protein [Niabella aurantiaca]|uniref:hypothetical protein n=1 Tax=Niabella aurantiaca TaxID=379900 RepID=UPI0003821622|nr:hypothetical protein [Niabella aurantiaca]
MQRLTATVLLIMMILGFSCKKSSENVTKEHQKFLGAWKLTGTTGGFGQLLTPYPETPQYVFLNSNGVMEVYNGKNKKTEQAAFIIYEKIVCGDEEKSTMLHTTYNSGKEYAIRLNGDDQLTIGSPACVNDGGVNIFERTYRNLPAALSSKAAF